MWIGHPGLLIEMIDTCDPILVDETTCYRIRITNQGTAPDTGIRVVANFPRQLEPVSVSGTTKGSIAGQTVTFDVYEQLDCQECIEYQITVRAMETGDARVRVELHSDLLVEPVTEEESTYVY